MDVTKESVLIRIDYRTLVEFMKIIYKPKNESMADYFNKIQMLLKGGLR